MKFIAIITTLILGISFSNSLLGQNIKIQQKPVTYDQKRKQLSLEYLKDRYGLIQNSPTITPIMIVLHYTAGGTINSNYNYFNKAEIESARKINSKESKLNVSSHYLIDRDGSIYQLIPDTLLARHVIGLNYCAIGVENIGSDKEPLTDAQVKANAALVKYLSKKYPIKYLIGHNEYLAFRKSNLWKEKDKNYVTHKIDPGADFMKKVRANLQGLNLKSQP